MYHSCIQPKESRAAGKKPVVEPPSGWEEPQHPASAQLYRETRSGIYTTKGRSWIHRVAIETVLEILPPYWLWESGWEYILGYQDQQELASLGIVNMAHTFGIILSFYNILCYYGYCRLGLYKTIRIRGWTEMTIELQIAFKGTIWREMEDGRSRLEEIEQRKAGERWRMGWCKVGTITK